MKIIDKGEIKMCKIEKGITHTYQDKNKNNDIKS